MGMYCCPSCANLLEVLNEREKIYGCPKCDKLFKLVSGNLKQIKSSYKEEKRKLDGGIRKNG